MSNLIELLLSRAESYDESGPSAKHTADMLREAANEISALKSRIEIRSESQEPASPPLPKECTCGMDGAKAWTPEFDEMVANDPLLARAASIICGAACGMYSACNSREAAVALRDAGLLALPTPTNRTAGETIGGGELAARLKECHGAVEDFEAGMLDLDLPAVKEILTAAIAFVALAPPPVEPALGVTEAMVEAVWGELAVRCSTTPGRDAVRYALRAALATAPEGKAEPVTEGTYLSAVKGRQDFREAYRNLRAEHLPVDLVNDALRAAVDHHGSYAEVSRITGLSDEYIRQAALRLRPITGKLLKFLGFERISAYKRIAK